LIFILREYHIRHLTLRKIELARDR